MATGGGHAGIQLGGAMGMQLGGGQGGISQPWPHPPKSLNGAVIKEKIQLRGLKHSFCWSHGGGHGGGHAGAHGGGHGGGHFTGGHGGGQAGAHPGMPYIGLGPARAGPP